MMTEEELGDPLEGAPGASPLPGAASESAPREESSPEGDDRTPFVDYALFVELASLVVLFSAVALIARYSRVSGLVWYAFAVGLISFLTVLLTQIAEKVKPGCMGAKVAMQEGRVVTVKDVVASFLLLWWSFGASFLTFRGPFVVASNGYFGAWGGLLATVRWSSSLVPELDGAESRLTESARGMKGRDRALSGLLASAFVLMLASIPHVAGGGTGAWGLSCAVVTMVVVAVLLSGRLDLGRVPELAVAGILVAMWICAAGVLTFMGPFELAGNGYFSSWIGLLFSLYYAAWEMGN